MKIRIALAPNKFAGGGEIPPYRTGDPSVLKRDLNGKVILPSFNDLFSNHRPEDIYEEEGYIPQEQGKGHQYTYNDIYTDYIRRLNKYNQSLPANDSANILTNERRTSKGLNRIGDTGAMPVVNNMFKGINTLLGYGMQAPVELAKIALMPGSYIPYVGATNHVGELMSGAVDNTAEALFAPIMPSNYIDWGSAGRDGVHLKLPWQHNSNNVETPAFMLTMDFVAAPYLAKGVNQAVKYGKLYVNPFYEGRNQSINLINDPNNIDFTGIDYVEDIMSQNSEKTIPQNAINDGIGKNIKNYGKTIANVINKAIKFDGANKFTRGVKGVARSFNPKVNKLLQVPGVMDYVAIYDIAKKNGLDNISEVFNERYGKKPQSKYILDNSVHAFDTKESLLKIFDASEKGYEYELLIDRYAASLKNKATQMYKSITDPSLKHLVDTSPLYLEEVYTQLLKGKTSKEIIKNLIDKVNTYSRYMTVDVPVDLARTLTKKLMEHGLDVEGILKSLDYGRHHYIFKGKPTLGNDYTTWWDNRIPKNTEASVGMHWYNPYDIKILRKINNDPIMKYGVFDTWRFNKSLGDAAKYYQYPAHLVLKPKSGNVLTDFEVFKPLIGEGIEMYELLYSDPTNFSIGYKYGGNLFPNGGNIEDDPDIPINNTLNTVNVYPTKIPGFQKWWNKTFRSKEGYYDWADRYAEKHPQDTNTIIVNPEEYTIINQRDLIADNAKLLAESGMLPPLWDRNLTVGANEENAIKWKKEARKNALYNQAKQVAENAEKGLSPIYDDEGNIAQYLPYKLALDSNDKPLSGTDPVGEFFVLNEALGPLAKFIGRGAQQVMARLGNQQARNQIMGRAFNNAADASFGFNNRFVTTPASNLMYEVKPTIRTKTGNIKTDNPIFGYKQGSKTSLKFYERPSKLTYAEKAGIPKGQLRLENNPEVFKNAEAFAKKYKYDVPTSIEDVKNMYRRHNRFFRTVELNEYPEGNIFFDNVTNKNIYPELKGLTNKEATMLLASKGYPLYYRTGYKGDLGKGFADDFVFVSPNLAENKGYQISGLDKTVMLQRPFSFGSPNKWHLNADYNVSDIPSGTYTKGKVGFGNAAPTHEVKLATDKLIPIKIAEEGDLGSNIGVKYKTNNSADDWIDDWNNQNNYETGNLSSIEYEMLPTVKTSVNDINPKEWTPEQWTAAQDDAIARGDMDEVQRLRDLHFNTFEKPQHYYRGSNSKRNTYFRDDGSAVWITPDKKAARHYAATLDNLRDLYVKLPKNIIEVDGKRRIYDDLLPWELPKEIQKVLPDAYKSYIRDKNYNFPLTTTDVAHYAKKAGYPVVKFKNVADATTGENPFYEQIATREYNNIKLADAVTYDDNGIRIPLGKRDNFNINDIRYGLAPLGFGIPYLMNNNNNQ